jgi:RHS repeat-associated protein
VTHLAGVQKYWYDANGNMTTRISGSNTYTLGYDTENRLITVSGAATATFVYDADGVRVRGTSGGVTTRYIGSYYEWTSAGSTSYYYAGSTRVAQRRVNYGSNNGLFWLTGDHLGSTSVTANSSGTKTAEVRYKPWGEDRYTSGSTLTTFKYTGQRQDSYINLYWYGSRWYDDSLNRWTQPDSIVPESSQGVQAWDRYCFVSNNPLRYVDPTGKYGADVHYYMTYSMMYTAVSRMGTQRGWTADQIRQVASSMAETAAQANISVDKERVVHGDKREDSVEGGSTPLEKLDDQFNETPHKMKLPDALSLVENSKGLVGFGEALHSLQDFYSHRMKPFLLDEDAFTVARAHNSKLDIYGYDSVTIEPVFGPGDDWYDFVDWMMYTATRDAINDYLDTLDWSVLDDLYKPSSTDEEIQN